MKTFKADVRSLWSGNDTLDVAAPSFLEAWKKVKRIMRKRRCRYRIFSLTETASLDG